MHALLDPIALLGSTGPFGQFILPAMLMMVFIESGLLFPFLPGDSLLFTGGLLAMQPDHFAPLWLLLLLVPIAAIAGDQVGYFLGHRFAPAIERRPDGRIFKREYLDRTHEFFAKHGPVTVILCRFVPIVRTYAPLVAGMARMRYRTFISYNIIGGLLWGAGVVALGALLGNVAVVRDHLEAIFLGIIALSLLPAALGALKARMGRAAI
ncbi:DedA family protein [Corynebacterium testudinoris]|uniref:Putative membrane-associated protein n=1 Tax=Corynebacterium testudinoris TaxID=136857 RepID=A0A0G3H9A6_9CORY|nr:VTT domain-containing protein [Corynebacterium testudinoris]AKK07697.1 putative membrane-associated protein [Corynebacterium testudinoris]MBX8995809.1 DedA family protein [Corynebacterium testudinoris]